MSTQRSNSNSKTGPSEAVPTAPSEAQAIAESDSNRTPKPSESLFSIGHFSIDDVDQLRQLIHESLTSFAVEVGTQAASCLLEDDVVKLCGEKSQRLLNRANSRHGSQPEYVILGGQKVTVRRPHVHSLEGEEVTLDVYVKLQSEDAMPQAALAKMVRGASCRDYEEMINTARAGFGVKKSSVNRHFVQATREQLQEFAERRLRKNTFCAVFIEGIAFSGEMMVVALGVAENGSKHVMGLVRGETENAETVTSLLTNLRERGLDTTAPTLSDL